MTYADVYVQMYAALVARHALLDPDYGTVSNALWIEREAKKLTEQAIESARRYAFMGQRMVVE